MKAVGILGGSFNPAHAGHRHISVEAIRRLGLDEVWWLVSPQNPLKTPDGMAPLATRLAAATMIANHRRIHVSDLEVSLGTRYAVDTVAALQRRYPNVRFIWLMGADNLAQFHHWSRWRRLAARVPIAVLARPGYMDTALTAPAMAWFGQRRHPARAARRWREWRLPAIVVLGIRMNPLSASAIRRADPDWATRSPAAATRRPIPRNPILALTHALAPAPPRGRPPRPVATGDAEVAALHALVLETLDDDQAVEVVSIPLAGKTSIADHMVIASGRSTRQVASLAAKIAERAKTELGRSVRVEGLPAADWVLIDAQDVIVHLFRPEVRNFYNLEKMWAFDGPSGSTGPGRAPPVEPVDISPVAVEHDPIEAEPVDPVAEGVDPAMLADED